MTRTLVQLVALMLATSAYAGAQSCSSYLFPMNVASVSSARINAPRTPVLDDNVCPTLSPACTSKAYLLQNDTVLRTPLTRDGYACIAFFNGKRQTTGWVQSSSLASMPMPATQGDWAGQWKRVTGHSDITIRRNKDGSYHAEALATYAVSAENVRTATAEGALILAPENAGVRIASFGETGNDRTTVCRVQLRQFGAWLLADDGVTDDSNSACGGLGVTLNGIYQRSLSN